MLEYHGVAVLLITITAFYLYTRAWIRMEMVSLLVLLALVLVFFAFPYVDPDAHITETEVLKAFGHPALVAICSLMILGRGLTMTGALEPVVRLLARAWNFNLSFGLLLTLMMAALASGFVNDTPVLVLMLPMLLSLAERTGYPASKTLMPVNFAILAGGMLTTIGTSTNLLVLSIAVDMGMAPMGVLAFTPLTAISLLVALPYLWLIAPRLLPARSADHVSVARIFETRIRVGDAEHPLCGRELADVNRSLGRDLPLVDIQRAGQRLAPDTLGKFEVGDRLFLRDSPAGLREIATSLRVKLFDEANDGDLLEIDPAKVDIGLAEVVVGNGSEFIGQTLKEVRFATRFRVAVAGLAHSFATPRTHVEDIADVPLRAGDVLLVLGAEDEIAELRRVPELFLIEATLRMPRSPQAPWALGIMALVVLVAATKLLPIHVAAFIGVVAMLLTGCVRLHGLGPAISVEVVLLVASSIALGQSLVDTGAAAWVAQGVTVVVQYFPPAVQLALFMAFAAVLTNFVSNTAAAAVGTPIAIATATQLGSPLEPFVLAILFGANLSFATPMAYQTNILVMNAAGYTFRDFIRVGTPLVLIMLVTLSVLLVRAFDL